jgi:hypothetical protein
MSETRVRSITVPTDRAVFERELQRLLGRMVMSRTTQDGEPIRRERALLEEARARESVDVCWRSIAARAGSEIDLGFVLFRNPQGRVERVLVQARGVERPRPPVGRPPPPPRFLTFDPSIEQMRRKRQELAQLIQRADRLAYDAQQSAAQHGSRIYDLDPEASGVSRTLQEIADAAEVVGGGPDPTGHGAEVAIELRIRRDLEQLAARRERAAERLRATLRGIDRALEERAREVSRFHAGGRAPGPIGRDTDATGL